MKNKTPSSRMSRVCLQSLRSMVGLSDDHCALPSDSLTPSSYNQKWLSGHSRRHLVGFHRVNNVPAQSEEQGPTGQ